MCGRELSGDRIMQIMSQFQTPSRTLTVVLSESEWRALRDVEPDAVGWVKDRIRERLSSAGHPESSPVAAAAASPSNGVVHWGDDEY